MQENERQKSHVWQIWLFQNGSNKVAIELRVVQFWSEIILVISNFEITRWFQTFVYVILRFRVQFEINLHECVFQKAEIARAALASAISAFWKTHKYKLISNWARKKDDFLLIKQTWKIRRKKCRKMFLETIFFAFEISYFRKSVHIFCHCFTWDHWPTKFSLSFCKS